MKLTKDQELLDDIHEALRRLTHMSRLLLASPDLHDLKTSAKNTYQLSLLMINEAASAASLVLARKYPSSEGQDNNPLTQLAITALTAANLTISPQNLIHDTPALIAALREEAIVMSAHPTDPLPRTHLDLSNIALQALAGQARPWFPWAEIVGAHARLLAPRQTAPDHNHFEAAYYYIANGLQTLIHGQSPPPAKKAATP